MRSPGQYKACTPSLLSLFYNPAEGLRLSSLFSCITEGRSLVSPAHIFSSHPTLHGGELQLPAHLTKETSSQAKLYHLLGATRCPAGELQTATDQQEHEGRSHKPARRFHRTVNCTATSFPFPWMGNKTGLNDHIRLSKTVYLILCDVYKFDLWCGDILVISYLKVMLVLCSSKSFVASILHSFSNLEPTHTGPHVSSPN